MTRLVFRVDDYISPSGDKSLVILLHVNSVDPKYIFPYRNSLVRDAVVN